MHDSFCVVATITPKAEHLDDARSALLELIPLTLEEEGCQTFRLLEAGDGRLWLYEEWDNPEALEAHYAQPYTRSVFAAYENWLAEPVRIEHLHRRA